MKDINIKLHTVLLLCGPSNSGKTHFSTEYLIPQLQKQSDPRKPLNIKYLSSDKIRRDLMGYDAHKYDRIMDYMSEQAFKILHNNLDAYMSYPVNADVIIVDTRGMAPEFRADIIAQCKNKNYSISCILFDYKERNDYYKHIDATSEQSAINVNKFVSDDINKFKKETLPELKKRDYSEIIRIKSNDFSEVNFIIEDYHKILECILPDGKTYAVVGDIHGCLDEFKILLERLGYIFNGNKISHPDPNYRLILVGDYIDKGPKVKETIEFIYENKECFDIVIGNHENFVYNYINGNAGEASTDQAVVDEYFGTVHILKDDEQLRNKFIELFALSKNFLIAPTFIVTHSPCEQKYLAKLGGYSQKRQRNLRYPSSDDYENKEEYVEKLEEALAFVKKESRRNLPYHFHGHIAVDRVNVQKNIVNLDTGVVYGGKLTAAVVERYNKPVYIAAAREEEEVVEEGTKKLFNYFSNKKSVDDEINLASLEPRERGRIFYAAEGKVNFISGTISPSDKDGVNLETVEKAFEYYRGKSIEKVVLQTKYMGSRSNVYLHKDIEKCYAVSRNGHKIDHVDLTGSFEKLLSSDKIKALMDSSVEYLILDAELMPWSALGKNLIDREFVTLGKAVEKELNFLMDNGFSDVLSSMDKEYSATDFAADSMNMSKKQLIEKYTDAKFRNYFGYKFFSKDFIPVEDQAKYLATYNEQLRLFGGESDVHFKPFAILKIVFVDGSEKLFFNENNYDMFKSISDDPVLLVDLNSVEDIEKAKEFYNRTTLEEKMEGIVVKPYIVYNKGIAPTLKVRNPDYLTIIYGFDYKHPAKYEKLINRKSINRKLKVSMEEFEIGKRMLEVPYNEISKENSRYTSLFAKMIAEESREKELDPRL